MCIFSCVRVESKQIILISTFPTLESEDTHAKLVKTGRIDWNKTHDPVTNIAKHIRKLVRNAGSAGIIKEELQKKLDISTKVSSDIINELIRQGFFLY